MSAERETLTDNARVAFLECDGDGAFEVNEDRAGMTTVKFWGEGDFGDLLDGVEGRRREGTCAF